MITLNDLRALLGRALAHAENPAIGRLTERTVEGMAMAYLPWRIALGDDHPEADGWRLVTSMRGCEGDGRRAASFRWKALDMRDPGTAHAILVALALALGLDPGVGGLGVRWIRIHQCGIADQGWASEAGGRALRFVVEINPLREMDPDVGAPLVAAEPDPIKALALAVRHVLEGA